MSDKEQQLLSLKMEAISLGSKAPLELMTRISRLSRVVGDYESMDITDNLPTKSTRRQISIPRINKSLFAMKAQIQGHSPGDVWRTSSGRWYTMNQDHRVTPTTDPSAQQEGKKPDKQEEQEQPTQLHEQGQPPAEEVKKGIMKQVSEFAGKNSGSVSRMLRKVRASTMRKLPPKSRKVIKKMAEAAAWVYEKMESFSHASQAMVKEIATEKGLSPDKVKKVIDALKWADAGFAWSVNIPVMHHALESTGLASGAVGLAMSKVAGFIPVASLAYIAYSTLQDPYATALAADKIIRHGIPKEEDEQEHSPNKKALDDYQTTQEKEDPHKDKQFDEMAISALCDIMQDAEDEEWAQAIFCAAVDHTQDPMQAVDATRAALKIYPSAPKASEEEEIEEDVRTQPFSGVGPSPFADRKKYLPSYKTKSEGTCKQGERADLTGCIPATGESGGRTHPSQEISSAISKANKRGIEFKGQKLQAAQDIAVAINKLISKGASTEELKDQINVGNEFLLGIGSTAEITLNAKGKVNIGNRKIGQPANTETGQSTTSNDSGVKPIKNVKVDIDDKLRKVLGNANDTVLAAACNAIDGSIVTYTEGTEDDAVWAANIHRYDEGFRLINGTTEFPDGTGSSISTFVIDPSGDIVVLNLEIALKGKAQKKGTGTEMFNNQVKALRDIGASKIVLMAAGNPMKPGNYENGYYTWPRLGYSGSTTFANIWDRIPPDLKKAMKGKDIQDLFAVQGGKEWWIDNGQGLVLEFNVSKDSMNSKILDEYIRSKNNGR